MARLPGRRKNKRTRILKFKVAHGSGDLVSIQISAKLKRVPKGLKITKQLLADLVRHKALTSSGQWDGRNVIGAREGDDPPGIELKIIRWRNPGRKSSSDRGWREGPQAEAWGSLWQIIVNGLLNVR